MKLTQSLLLDAASLMVLRWSSLMIMTSVACAQTVITKCPAELQETCALQQNRTCYYYESFNNPSAHTCGYCLNGFIEINDYCYDIDDIGTEKFTLMPELLEEYLPEFADLNATTDLRSKRLVAVSKIISSWNSYVPPPSFSLGFNQETFLTLEERAKRLGIMANLRYSPVTVDGDLNLSDKEMSKLRLGNLERFVVKGISTNNGIVDEDIDPSDDDYLKNEIETTTEETTTSSSLAQGSARKIVRRRGTKTAPVQKRTLEEILPPAIDWHDRGVMTEVKNQGLCGCCWAVSTAAAIESAMYISDQSFSELGKAFKGRSLSFQQMISCDEENYGCDGGNIFLATKYSWVHDDLNNGNMGGLISNADYPFEDLFDTSTTTCDVSGKTPKAYLNAPKIVTTTDDRSSFEERRDLTMAAVAQQPITSVLRSGCDLFMSYIDGVMTHDTGCQCCTNSCIDHAVVIVGFNTTAETPYWKLRNSWGDKWGEEGYFRIAMNDPGCGWGLFGMLAESALPADVYASLEDLPEREYPNWWQLAHGWEKALVVVASILGACCLCGCVGMIWQKHRS